MKKYFVFSDVHSFYDELMTALEEKGFDINNLDHIVISCGDLFDRGDQSKECLEFIISMLKQDRAICIKGNHEDLAEDLFHKWFFDDCDVHNGTEKTFKHLTTLDPIVSSKDIINDVRSNKDFRYYLMKCQDYYELGNNIFVHGWIPSYVTYKKFTTTYKYMKRWRNGNWHDARWSNGMDAWRQGVKEKGKTIWCGHWHSSWGHCNLHHDGQEFISEFETMWIDPKTGRQMPYVRRDTFVDEGIRCLDACTVLSHKVNIEVIEA